MNTDPHLEAIAGILDLVDRINSLASDPRLVGYEIFDVLPSNGLPMNNCAQLTFVQAVFWLHSLYSEIGRTHIEFLMDQVKRNAQDPDGECSSHIYSVSCLRNQLAHHQDHRNERSRNLYLACEVWYYESCGESRPVSEASWRFCLDALFNAAESTLRSFADYLSILLADGDANGVVSAWKMRIRRNPSFEEIDRLVQECASDFGQDNIDVIVFRNRHFRKWKQAIKYESSDFSFYPDARAIVERDLVNETMDPLPLTALDVMDEWNVAPGPIVAKYLKMARWIYDSKRCSKGDLLNLMREVIKNGGL